MKHRVVFGEALGGRKIAMIFIHDVFANLTLMIPPKQYSSGVPMFNLESTAREADRDARDLTKTIGGTAAWEPKEYPMVKTGGRGFMVEITWRLKYALKSETDMAESVEIAMQWCKKNGYVPEEVLSQ